MYVLIIVVVVVVGAAAAVCVCLCVRVLVYILSLFLHEQKLIIFYILIYDFLQEYFYIRNALLSV
jgi:hypothetical protein